MTSESGPGGNGGCGWLKGPAGTQLAGPPSRSRRVCSVMLTVLGGLAEFERELIRARTSEGRKRAKERGVRFGRPRKLTPHQRHEARARLSNGETLADIARSYNVDATTIGRLQ